MSKLVHYSIIATNYVDNDMKASLVSFAPEDVDVDWIISETDEYWIWTDRNPL